ncbi:uncharacterized protein [Chironomus tepperi]|uniref:uncharacterized protein n=1 Tax=Chironomus tepperi TaxID=113505 RepID=UPI00391EEF5C
MYKIVEFLEENNACEIVQSRWMLGDDAVYFPPLAKYNGYIKNIKTDMKVIKNWSIFKAKILIDNVETFDAAKEASKFYSEYGNSEYEEHLKEMKKLKRKHPINFNKYGDLDLRNQVKKLKNTDQVNDNNLATVSLPSTCPLSPTVQLPTTFSSGSIPSHVSSAHSLPIESKLTDNVNNSVSNEVLLEYAPNDASTTMILEIEKMLQRMKTEIIEELKREIKIQVLSALSSGRTNGRDLSSFEKIKSKIDFQEFVEKLNDTTTKNNMASMLKLLHDSSGCYKSANGRIATIMTYLFSNEFIKKELAWGSMNGRPSDRICLINYPIFFEMIVESFKGSDGNLSCTVEVIRSAFQIFFKHKAKKL